jgi:plasmid replication initiation protein
METELTAIQIRQAEIAQYEANIVLFEQLIASLPTEWPAHLVEHRNAENKHTEAAKVENLADVELISQLWYADQCAASIRSEMVELTKAKAILSILDK